jgi:protein TonB
MTAQARNRRRTGLRGLGPRLEAPLARQAWKVSVCAHVAVVLVLLLAPLVAKGCARPKEAEALMFVEFTVSVPPPAQEAPPEEPKPEEKVPEPEPEPPPEPEPVIPEPVPEPKKPEPEPKKEEAKKPPEKPKPKVIRQTNMVTRTFAANAPVAKDKPLSEAEIAKLLKAGAKLSDRTSVPSNAAMVELGAYNNHVRDRLYAAWNQPAGLQNLPGMSCDAQITVEPGGKVSSYSVVRPSGNSLMDQSVRDALASVPSLKPLPAGITTAQRITITFELQQ